jgi:hypothetical protein
MHDVKSSLQYINLQVGLTKAGTLNAKLISNKKQHHFNSLNNQCQFTPNNVSYMIIVVRVYRRNHHSDCITNQFWLI